MYKLTKIAAAIALTAAAVSVQAENYGANAPGYAPVPPNYEEAQQRRAAADRPEQPRV